LPYALRRAADAEHGFPIARRAGHAASPEQKETPMNAYSYVGAQARRAPDKAAIIHGASGATLSYRDLDERSNRFAHYLYALGLRRGDHIAVVLENNIRYFEIVWAALRSGLVLTPVNRFLTPDEAAYIIADCGAQVAISSHAMRDLAEGLTLRTPGFRQRLMIDGVIDGWDSYEAACADLPGTPLGQESLGVLMMYSSGTTGRPKGILRAPWTENVAEVVDPNRRELLDRYQFGEDMAYLATAPLYHSAPLTYGVQTQCAGGTLVLMEKFDAAQALALIERYRITHSQWVPTMFVRMLKLPPEQRRTHDLSSLRVAIHAAAPCPIDVKRKMIAWWGPILYEYYGTTEGNGLTTIDSQEWLAHPGSVGRPFHGILHICDDDGRELPPMESGLVYFEQSRLPFHYHKDPEKTRSAQHPHHPNWTAVGDVGYVDEEGYLYLTDRKSFMIISGGVNIYPQAIEDALAMHPHVGDAAVIGVPNEEMGEEVKAIIEPAAGVAPSEALARELIEYLREKVARYMVPRSVDFIDHMPRLPTGKLYKQALREKYCAPARQRT